MADSKETGFDYESAFRLYYGRVARLIARIVRDPPRLIARIVRDPPSLSAPWGTKAGTRWKDTSASSLSKCRKTQRPKKDGLRRMDTAGHDPSSQKMQTRRPVKCFSIRVIAAQQSQACQPCFLPSPAVDEDADQGGGEKERGGWLRDRTDCPPASAVICLRDRRSAYWINT